MHDPDLVRRAERAAVALERAWGHWRVMHGLDTSPLPPVTSYVGYSFDEPWGQPRVVFGVGAEEAERLAALLDGHDCVGPVHAELTGRPDWRRTAPADPAAARTWPLSDALSIPAQRQQPASDLLPPGAKADTATLDETVTGSGATDPVVADPVVADPVVADRAAADPVPAEPVAADPVPAEPVAADPVKADPVPADPAAGGASPRLPGANSPPPDSAPAATAVFAEPTRVTANGGDVPSSAAGSEPPVASRSQLSPMLPAVPMLPVPTHDLAGVGKANANGPKGGSAAAGQPRARQPKGRQPEARQPEAPQPEARQPRARQPEARQPEARQPEASQPRARQSEAGEGGEASPASDLGLAAELSLAAESRQQDESAGPVEFTAAPTSGGHDTTPSQGPGYRGRRYQGLPPRYQPGPVPEPPAELERAENENVAATTEPPDAGMSGKLSRLSRSRRAGKHDAGGWPQGGHAATDTAV
jgi:hypothetical protein